MARGLFRNGPKIQFLICGRSGTGVRQSDGPCSQTGCAGTTGHHGEPQHVGGKRPVGNSMEWNQRQAAASSSTQQARVPLTHPSSWLVPDPALVSLTAAPRPLDTLRSFTHQTRSAIHSAMFMSCGDTQKPTSHRLLGSPNREKKKSLTTPFHLNSTFTLFFRPTAQRV